MTKASLQAAPTASATPTAHAMTVAATAVIDAIRRRQRDFLADPRSVLDPPCSLTLRTRSWPRSSSRTTRRSRRWGSVLATTRGALHGRFPPRMQRNTLCPLQISTPTGWPDMASTRICGDPCMGVGGPDRGSSHRSGTRRARLASAGGDPALLPRGTARRGGRHQGA